MALISKGKRQDAQILAGFLDTVLDLSESSSRVMATLGPPDATQEAEHVDSAEPARHTFEQGECDRRLHGNRTVSWSTDRDQSQSDKHVTPPP